MKIENIIQKFTCFSLSQGYIVPFTPHLLHILCVGNTLMNVKFAHGTCANLAVFFFIYRVVHYLNYF